MSGQNESSMDTVEAFDRWLGTARNLGLDIWVGHKNRWHRSDDVSADSDKATLRCGPEIQRGQFGSIAALHRPDVLKDASQQIYCPICLGVCCD